MKKKKNTIREIVYEFPTKNREGFTDDELKELLSQFPKINMKKYNEAMWGNTCMMKAGKIITYWCDVFSAISCGVENRSQRIDEWD